MQVNYTSIDAAIDIITNNGVTKAQTLHDTSVDDSCNQPSTSGTSNVMDDARHIVDNVCNPVFCRDGVNNGVTKAQTLHDMSVDDSCNPPSTSGTSNVMDDARHIVDNVCNPVFCRDGVSATLEMLYNTAGVKTHHHAVFVLIHALMLESGFCLKVLGYDLTTTIITTTIIIPNKPPLSSL